MGFFEYLGKHPIYVVIVAIAIFLIIVAGILRIFVVPKLKWKWLNKKVDKTKPEQENSDGTKEEQTENNDKK